MSGHDPEPIRGLPAVPPPGEKILWQGSPEWRSLAIHAFHVRKVAIYFGLLGIASLGFALGQDKPFGEAAASVSWLLILAVGAVALLTLFAWLTARTTVYTLTSRRLAIRYGIALPMTVNVPYNTIGTAALATYPGGTGDIPIALATDDRLAYLVLWPHARPWKLARPQPMLRSVPDAARVATILGRALLSSHEGGSLTEPKIVTVANDPMPATAGAALRRTG